jgi:hypothetical protein
VSDTGWLWVGIVLGIAAGVVLVVVVLSWQDRRLERKR